MKEIRNAYSTLLGKHLKYQDGKRIIMVRHIFSLLSYFEKME
jgi:hypothetical protein